MAIELNGPALRHARALVRDGKVVKDERDDWSEAAPTADEENSFIEKTAGRSTRTGISGSTSRRIPRPKGAYSFPFGDFRRCTARA